MSNVSKLNLDGVSYNIKDEDARSDITDLNSRINNLVLQASGNDVTEVVDARTGIDDSAYPVLKSRIDTEINNLHYDVDLLAGDAYKDVLVETTFQGIATGFIKTAVIGSAFTTNTTSTGRRGYISVNPGEIYSVSGYATATMAIDNAVALVATNNNNITLARVLFTHTETGTVTNTIFIPKGATRLWFDFYRGSDDAFQNTVVIYRKERISIEEISNKIGDYCYDEERETLDLSPHCTMGYVPYATTYGNNRIGKTLTFNTNASFGYSYLEVNSGEMYKVTTPISSNYDNHAVFFTDNQMIIVDKQMKHVPGDEVPSTGYSGYVIVPSGATRMYIISWTNNTTNFLRRTYCQIATLSTVNNAINRIENFETVKKPLDYLPPYYTDEWINTRITAVKTNTQIDKGISFGFITDVHISANQMRSQYMAKEILNETSVPFFVFGGDVVRAYGSKTDMESDADGWFKWVKYVRDVFQIRGNHDYAIKTSANEETGYTEPIGYTYNHVMGQQEWKVEGDSTGKMYYMLDNKIQHIRMLFLNAYEQQESGSVAWGVRTYQTQEQYDWIIEKLTEVENYGFVVFTHASPDQSGNIEASGGWGGLNAIEHALNNKTTVDYYHETSGVRIIADFSSTTNEIICNISGHNHKDRSNVENGVLSITTTSDATYNNDVNVPRTSLTTTEQAFDIFTIDTENRTIKTVRFGGGNNRTWTY